MALMIVINKMNINQQLSQTKQPIHISSKRKMSENGSADKPCTFESTCILKREERYSDLKRQDLSRMRSFAKHTNNGSKQQPKVDCKTEDVSLHNVKIKSSIYQPGDIDRIYCDDLETIRID